MNTELMLAAIACAVLFNGLRDEAELAKGQVDSISIAAFVVFLTSLVFLVLGLVL